MLLDLIYGKIGSGKTEKCIELIEKTLEKNPGHKAVLTVPDQYSFTAEKRIVEKLGGTGLNGVEVLTFSQFFRRYLNQGKNYLSPSGKQMLYYRAITKNENAESIFARSAQKSGFVDEIAQLASEMKRYMITPEILRDTAGDEDSILARKLREFADIFENYNSMLKPEFVDSEDDFLRLAQYIIDSDEFENTHIWFDGFADFMPYHYAVIKAFLTRAASVHVSLPIDEASDEEGVFSLTFKTRERLKKMCEENGARLYEQYCDDESKSVKSAELLHLIKNWDTRKKVFDQKAENISLFCARDLYSEIEHVAKGIWEEVKNGKRFRDIGVMCSDMGQYSHLIEAVFGDYNIPYFTDIGLPVTEHPIILTLLAAFEITEENWSYESVFKYLRTGFVYEKNEEGVFSLNRERIDRLENYVLRQGIRGKKEWLSPDDWEENAGGVFDAVLEEQKKTYDNMEKINAIRRTVIKPFERFYENTSGRRSVRELAKALYEFLLDINLYEGIGKEVYKLNQEGRRNEAEQMKEIWNLLIEVINQAAVVLGDEHSKKEDFMNMIRAGFSKAVLQIIPSGLDCVSVGDAGRNSPVSFKSAFFVGAVAGTMPNEAKTGGILTDAERKTLSKKGVEAAADSEAKARQENFKFFKSVTSVSEKLFFSYPVSDLEGVAKQPAAIIKDFYKMFPDMNISDDLLDVQDTTVFNSKQAFLYVMNAVSDKSMKKNAEEIKKHFKDDEEFLRKIKMAEYASEYRKVQPEITKESAKLLYEDKHNYSVSRLSDYAACPFNYFVKHGLKAKEQEIYKIQKFEIGSLLHWAVCEYCKEVENGCKNFKETTDKWRVLTDGESDTIIDKIMSDIATRVLGRVSRNKNKIEYLLQRMKKILKRSIEIVRLSLSRGEYSAVCYEEKFEIEVEWKKRKITLDGIIDRVDAAEYPAEGKISLRIIDYKSGKKDFNVVSISNNTDMQLVVYSIAATELYKKGSLGRAQKGLSPTVGGILYNKLRDDMVSCTSSDMDKLDELLKKDMKLDGVIVSDGDDIKAAKSMDKTLNAGKKSEFMKLVVNAKGDNLDMRYSAVASREKFNILTDFVRKTTVKLDEEIYSGNIDISPTSGKSTNSCAYCKYREICLYDANIDKSRGEIESTDEAWEFMEKEIKD